MNSFNTNENKNLLWELLNNHNLFKDIDNQHYQEVQKLFEEEIVFISNNNKSLDLVEQNKKFLSSIITKLNKYKTPVIFTHTAAELQLKKQKELDNSYNKKQNEFNELINSHIPSQSINFSDEIDKPFEDDIDKIINETIASRDLQIENIIQTQSNSIDHANSWIANNNPNAARNITIGETLNKQIIDSNISNINDTNKMPLFFEKSVKFNLDNNNNNNNKTDVNMNNNNNNNVNMNNNEDYNKLQLSIDKILENQEKILNLLK